jgi:hypothetical protein
MHLGEIEWDGVDWMIMLRIGTSAGSCEDGNEPSGSMKYWEVLEWQQNWRLLKKGSAP